MKIFNLLFYIFIFEILLFSCATSMTPLEVNNTLPSLTQSTFFNQTNGLLALENNKCKILVKNRIYVAPMGYSVNEDLKNAAIGIDEWVNVDGGNAYILNNYKWVTVDDIGSTQLHVDFHTLKCN